jgi:hypothetical protein
MATRVWTFDLDGVNHVVELQHGTISGTRIVLVDGQVVGQGKRFVDFGSTHPFQIGQHSGAVAIRTKVITFSYDLTLDGSSLGAGTSASTQTPVSSEQASLAQSNDDSWLRFLAVGLHILSWPFFFLGGIGLAYTVIPFLLTNFGGMPDQEIWPILSRFLLGVALAGAFWGIGALLRFLARKVEAKLAIPPKSSTPTT